MSDDPVKCVHMHLGMASSCGYRVTGAGTIAEHHYWVCSDACKAEQHWRDLDRQRSKQFER